MMINWATLQMLNKNGQSNTNKYTLEQDTSKSLLRKIMWQKRNENKKKCSANTLKDCFNISSKILTIANTFFFFFLLLS